jgi:hypothetical protein
MASVLRDFCGTDRIGRVFAMSSEFCEQRFQDRPNQEDLPSSWKVLRASKKGTPTVMILSDDVTGCYVHYWHGRTRPCFRNDCEPCAMGQQPRWRGYLAVWTPKPSTGRLLEITGSVIQEIDRWLKQEGTLRASTISLSRKGNVNNGELNCKLAKPSGFAVELPPGPNVMQLLARLWKLTHDPKPSELAIDAHAAVYGPTNFDRFANSNGSAGKAGEVT